MKVFGIARHDLYGEQFLREYLTAIRLAPGWDEVLDEKRVNWVLMPGNSSLANMLKETHRWRVIYADDVAVLLEREQGGTGPISACRPGLTTIFSCQNRSLGSIFNPRYTVTSAGGFPPR